MDLKPDNILVGHIDLMHAKAKKLYLIDFGITESFKSLTGEHRKKSQHDHFRGNLVFSSIN